MNEFVKVVKTQKAHGIKGELKLHVEDHFIDDLFETEALFVEIKGQKIPYFIENLQEGNALILKLEGVDTRTESEQLMHKDVYMNRDDISLSDEIIASEGLVYKFTEGFKIVDILYGEIAEIEEVVEFPQQEMAYVTYKNKTLLLPLHPNFVVEVDRENKILTMNLPEGLLDL
jgi:16S rRNA processing protein RimM